MDSTYAGHGFGETYSQFSRLRTGSGVSTTEDFLPNLHVADSSSFDIGSYPSTRSQSSQGQPSPAYFSPTLSQSPSFLSTPVSQQQQPFSLLPSEGATNSEWFGAKCQSRETPLLQVESATAQSRVTRSSSPLASTETETMSTTTAISYDPGFSVGTRSAYPSWPGVDSGSSLVPPEYGAYGSDAGYTPPSGSRSVTASPPRIGLTPEQRELKRQHDQARHNAKLQIRGRRMESPASSVYSPPATLGDLTTSTTALPVYTTAPAQLPLLSEPPTQYMGPYNQPTPSMYATPYSPPQNTYLDYTSYPPPAAPSLPSQQYGLGVYHPVAQPYPAVTNANAAVAAAAAAAAAGSQVRVVQSRPKPQCWDHGCNGRQFSTFSNLLRHQREKSGQAAKATCPNCGAEFTRTTARNGHLLHDKCKKKNIQNQQNQRSQQNQQNQQNQQSQQNQTNGTSGLGSTTPQNGQPTESANSR